MGLRAKFNLLMLLIALVGAGLFALAANPLVDSIARDEVLQSSRIMMESAAGARKYTSEQVAPVLKPMIGAHFYPQSVSAYAAKRNFDVIHAKFPDFAYREAALNPTNPQDRATDWEADIIDEFRSHPEKQEISLVRDTATGPMLELARPLVNKAACLECHNTAPRRRLRWSLFTAQRTASGGNPARSSVRRSCRCRCPPLRFVPNIFASSL